MDWPEKFRWYKGASHLTPEATVRSSGTKELETSFPFPKAIFYWKDNLLSTYGQRILLDIELGIRKKKAII
jgi:hypothetical protein